MKLVCISFLVLASLSLQAQQVRITLGGDATLILERSPFKVAGKVLKFYGSKQPNISKSLVSINGKPIFGTDGELPKFTLKQAVLVLHGHRYNLRTDGMYNPWFGLGSTYGPDHRFFKGQMMRTSYRVQALFSDGAGTYAAEWLVTGKTVRRTRLTADEDQLTNYFSAVSKP
jgi:hypothetical protein